MTKSQNKYRRRGTGHITIHGYHWRMENGEQMFEHARGSCGGSMQSRDDIRAMRVTLPAQYSPPVSEHGALTTCRGISIGGARQAAMPEMTANAELIQRALLDSRTAQPLPLLKRAAGALWRWS